ncbi:unnamed protein product [Urochloa decumbens]|uniref:non-specific serine/threonine protein kinase n=1 Tax=Urochloa decumbens TaxID=240449 RepID=A0ABC8Z6R9_9POAL
MGSHGFFTLILLICFIPRYALAGYDDISTLFKLRDVVTEGKGFLSNWFDSETPPCSWSGITCDNHTVVRIDLSSVPIYAPFPLCVVLFQSLVHLNFSGCGFSGELPDAWGNLHHLQYLDLSRNQLTGSLPISLYGLRRLKELKLDNNIFSGQLSPAIAQFQYLKKLSVSTNSISGALPPELGSLQNLEFLDLHMNAFNGSIPASLGNLSRLLHLDASQNNLGGSLFPGITAMTNLVTVDLSSNALMGPLPREIGQLQNLQLLILGHNGFSGSIPEEIGELKLLEELILSECKLTGIPWAVGDLRSLKLLDISGNNFKTELPTSIDNLGNLSRLLAKGAGLSGNIPKELGRCRKLVYVDLSTNSFSGSIPEELAGLEAIANFNVGQNNLSGQIPEWIQNWAFRGCKKLTELNLQGNHLHGELPQYLSELPLVSVELSQNNFTGKLPENLWESSTILEITLSYKQLTGPIPKIIGRLSSLQRLRIDNNYLEGPIPQTIGALRNLTTLSLHGNRLSGNIPLELFNCRNLVTLDPSSNNLSGHIIRAISQLTFLNTLNLSSNLLSGAIPAEICVGFENAAHPDSEFIQHHGLLDLSYNRFSSHIPSAIKNCATVTVLNLQGNMLSGTIPSELGGSIPTDIDQILPKIAELDLSSNAFTGSLPESLLCINDLTYLDVSNNSLSGQIPFSCPKEKKSSSSLIFFNGSSNHFSGNLDESISNFTKLSSFDIHNNSLTGSLPFSLSDLSYLNYLDLSNNNFHGVIPCGICNLFGLTFANFSGNHIGMYTLADCAAKDFCTVNGSGHKTLHSSGRRVPRLAIICVCIIIATIVLVLLVVLLRWKPLRNRPLALVPANKAKATVEPTSSDELLGKKFREPLSINLATFEHALLRVTADDILKATENFSKVHIIGDGGFGTVYRAALPEGRRVAIKRLHGGHQFQGDREFLAEMETIGKVKHPNLVPLLGYCVCGDERFLIYEYMENGSLEMWLRNRADAIEALGWPDRLKICVGSARGLSFLHHGFVPHIIHRDMKSSNILLDENFEPRVSDFGLARIISACETHVSTDIAGTFGYIPPEYGMTMKSSTKGDVYSFGVVMLELLTGRPPTGQEGGRGWKPSWLGAVDDGTW